MGEFIFGIVVILIAGVAVYGIIDILRQINKLK
jgi:hypothetical protein